MTKEQENILVAAADSGDVYINGSDQHGKWVMAGSTEFVDFNDRAVAAVGLDALESLRKSGLVRHDGENYYPLTGSGFKTARELKASRSKRDKAQVWKELQSCLDELDEVKIRCRKVCPPAEPLESGKPVPVIPADCIKALEDLQVIGQLVSQLSDEYRRK